jgi:hypothetical protein
MRQDPLVSILSEPKVETAIQIIHALSLAVISDEPCRTTRQCV